jgi:hypothetical protein
VLIGSFFYDARIEGNCIGLELFWDERGERAARVLVTQDIREAAIADQIPDPEAAMSLDSAVAYGMFLAMHTGASFRLCGDETAWPEQWGELTKVQ